MSSTYGAAGVDVDAGRRFIQMIRERVAKPYGWDHAPSQIGRFAGGGPIPESSVAFGITTDGIGTKVILAALLDKYELIGHDVVAMTAMDAYCAGYRPVGFVDTLKVAKLQPERHIAIIEGMIHACAKAGCVMLGGETAEMPGLFKHDWMLDVDATVVGFQGPSLTFVPVRPGQLVYGWDSFGLGCNGFSLVRKIFRLDGAPSEARRRLNRRWKTYCNLRTLGYGLLYYTPLWIWEIDQQVARGVKYAGHAHITGGGLIENVPRILPEDMKVVIRRNLWERPAIFRFIQEEGGLTIEEMDKVFNNGVMVVSIVDGSGNIPGNVATREIGVVEERRGDEPQIELRGDYHNSPL